MNRGCGHNKIAYGHCAFMFCPNYRSLCPLHAIAKTGDGCNRTIMSRLIDEHGVDRGEIIETSMKDSGDPDVRLYEVYVKVEENDGADSSTG